MTAAFAGQTLTVIGFVLFFAFYVRETVLAVVTELEREE